MTWIDTNDASYLHMDGNEHHKLVVYRRRDVWLCRIFGVAYPETYADVDAAKCGAVALARVVAAEITEALS